MLETKFIPKIKYTWSRYPVKGKPHYEVSSKGDPRFSALNAKLSDGITIEEFYQLDIKGYRDESKDWKYGKGKSPKPPGKIDDCLNLSIDVSMADGENKLMVLEIESKRITCNKVIIDENPCGNQLLEDIKYALKLSNSSVANCGYYSPEDVVLAIPSVLNGEKIQKSEKFMDELLSAGMAKVKSICTISRGLPNKNMVNSISKIIGGSYKQINDTGYFVDLYTQYKDLWYQWMSENVQLFEQLAEVAHGKTLTDCFASTEINQARVLSELLNEYYDLR